MRANGCEGDVSEAMGCISVQVSREGGVSVSAERRGGLSAAVQRAGGVAVVAASLGGIGAGTVRRGGIRVSAGLVCTVNVSLYLRVQPQEVQWVDVWMPVDYEIQSNTDWNIV